MNNDQVISYGFFCDIENPEYEHLYKYKTTSFNFNKNKKYKIIYEQKDIPCFPNPPFISKKNTQPSNEIYKNNSTDSIEDIEDEYIDSCISKVCIILTAFAISIYCIYYLP